MSARNAARNGRGFFTRLFGKRHNKEGGSVIAPGPESVQLAAHLAGVAGSSFVW
jgi:hypothetical protein